MKIISYYGGHLISSFLLLGYVKNIKTLDFTNRNFFFYRFRLTNSQNPTQIMQEVSFTSQISQKK